MTKDVLVSVTGTQFFGDGQDAVEIITPGTYYLKNGKHYILYDEAIADTDIVTHNTVKAAPGQVEVAKNGAVETRMVFESGKKTMANYLTPLGLIVLGLTTVDIKLREEENAVHVNVDYALEMNGEHVSNCQIGICAQSRETAALHLSGERNG